MNKMRQDKAGYPPHSPDNPCGLTLGGLDANRPIHMAGIAGSAMSGLARILRQRGFAVVGTDPRAGEANSCLTSLGIPVFEEQDGSRIVGDTQLVIATAALPQKHPELNAARNKGIPIVSYADFLGVWMADSDGVAISGTHGKTTVSSMVVTCLRQAGISPGFVIGGLVPGLGTNADSGDSPLFVAEACEFNRSFLSLSPRIAVITNIEEDHLDIYNGLSEIQEAFSAFVSGLKDRDGLLVYSAECRNSVPVVRKTDCAKLSFGIEAKADISARNIKQDEGAMRFDLYFQGAPKREIRLTVPGRHNVQNALAAIGVCHALGVSFDDAAIALEQFSGASRRFEIRGEANGITIVDDYAHHPTEIRALLQAARARFPGRRVVIVFQPHQHSRTRFFLESLSEALSEADLSLIPDIYAARDSEEDKKTVNSKDLVDKIVTQGKSSYYVGGLENVVGQISKRATPGDVLLIAGAGDIDSIIPQVLQELRAR